MVLETISRPGTFTYIFNILKCTLEIIGNSFISCQEDRSHCRTLSDPVVIRWKLLDPVGQNSGWKLSNIGKRRNNPKFNRNPNIPTLSNM